MTEQATTSSVNSGWRLALPRNLLMREEEEQWLAKGLDHPQGLIPLYKENGDSVGAKAVERAFLRNWIEAMPSSQKGDLFVACRLTPFGRALLGDENAISQYSPAEPHARRRRSDLSSREELVIRLLKASERNGFAAIFGKSVRPLSVKNLAFLFVSMLILAGSLYIVERSLSPSEPPLEPLASRQDAASDPHTQTQGQDGPAVSQNGSNAASADVGGKEPSIPPDQEPEGYWQNIVRLMTDDSTRQKATSNEPRLEGEGMGTQPPPPESERGDAAGAAPPQLQEGDAKEIVLPETQQERGETEAPIEEQLASDPSFEIAEPAQSSPSPNQIDGREDPAMGAISEKASSGRPSGVDEQPDAITLNTESESTSRDALASTKTEFPPAAETLETAEVAPVTPNSSVVGTPGKPPLAPLDGDNNGSRIAASVDDEDANEPKSSPMSGSNLSPDETARHDTIDDPTPPLEDTPRETSRFESANASPKAAETTARSVSAPSNSERDSSLLEEQRQQTAFNTSKNENVSVDSTKDKNPTNDPTHRPIVTTEPRLPSKAPVDEKKTRQDATQVARALKKQSSGMAADSAEPSETEELDRRARNSIAAQMSEAREGASSRPPIDRSLRQTPQTKVKSGSDSLEPEQNSNPAYAPWEADGKADAGRLEQIESGLASDNSAEGTDTPDVRPMGPEAEEEGGADPRSSRPPLVEAPSGREVLNNERRQSDDFHPPPNDAAPTNPHGPALPQISGIQDDLKAMPSEATQNDLQADKTNSPSNVTKSFSKVAALPEADSDPAPIEASSRPVDLPLPKPKPVIELNEGTLSATARPNPSQQSGSDAAFTVQFASLNNTDDAEEAAKIITERLSSLLGDRPLHVVEGVVSNQTFFRVRIDAPLGFQDASNICNNAKQRGQDCFVAKQ